MSDNFYKISAYKSGVDNGTPHWDITFTNVDFNAFAGYATIDGPISLLIDVDASQCTYPTLYGIEISTVDKSINITDSPQIAFVPRGERKVITPGSVPQLAYITGTITAITIHCFGFVRSDAPLCKVSLRVGPAAVLTAPTALIGRATMAQGASVFIGQGSALGAITITPIPANSTGTVLVTHLVPIALGLRERYKHIQLQLDATPSFAGDLIGYISIIDRSAVTTIIGRVISSDTYPTLFSLPTELILDVGQTLKITVDNSNPSVTYNASYTTLYEEIY